MSAGAARDRSRESLRSIIDGASTRRERVFSRVTCEQRSCVTRDSCVRPFFFFEDDWDPMARFEQVARRYL
jgi:hypothetical protein